MGCCAGRPKAGGDSTGKGSEGGNTTAGGPGLLKRNSQYYHTKSVFNKSEDQIKRNQLQNQEDPEFAELSLARENQDLKKMVEFIPSAKVLKEKLDLRHPWAAPPETIGSVALMFITLSITQSTDESSPEGEVKAEAERISKHTELLRTLDIGTRIKENLTSDSADRYELSVLMTMFMLENNPKNQEYLLETGVMPLLINYLDKSYQKGLKLAAFQCCSYLYRGRPVVCKFFCQSQGLEHLADFLRDTDDLMVNEALTALDELTLIDVNDKKRNEDLMKLIDEKQFIPLIESYLEKHKNTKDITNEELKALRETNLQYISFLKSIWSSFSTSDPRTVPEDPVDNNHVHSDKPLIEENENNENPNATSD